MAKKSLTIQNRNGDSLYPVTVSSLVYNRITGVAVEQDLNNLKQQVIELTGIDNVFFGGIVQTANDIITDYSSNEYEGVYLYMVGSDMTSLIAYQYNGSGSPTQLFSGTTYDFSDYSDVKSEVNSIRVVSNKNSGYISIIRSILEHVVFKDDVSALFEALDLLDQEVTSITLDESSISISGFGTQTIVATTIPSTARVSWLSSDTSVATVSDGVVTSVGNGTCTITAIAGSLSATCSVTVSGIVPIEYVDFEGDSLAKSLVLANYPHPTNANEITTAEAAAVTSLFVNGTSPFANTAITNANWLRHFTGIYQTEDVSSNTKGFGKEFAKCQSLTSIIIPEGIQHLCQDGMYQCTALSNITLPSTLTQIAIRGLYCVPTTGVITLKATNCSLAYSGISGISSSNLPQAIYVPSSSVSNYQGKSNWSSFASVIQAITE